MLKHALAFLIVICFSAPAGYTNPQVGDARNLMWCSANSEGKMDAHRAEFQKDTSDWRHPSGGNHSKASFFLCFHASVVSVGCVLWKFVAVANRGFDRFQVVIGY